MPRDLFQESGVNAEPRDLFAERGIGANTQQPVKQEQQYYDDGTPMAPFAEGSDDVVINQQPVQRTAETFAPGIPIPTNSTAAALMPQAIGRGLVADIVGMPVDLMNLAITGAGAASNSLFGTDFKPIEKPLLGSDHIAEAFAPAAEAVGLPVKDYEQMSPSEQYAYNAMRFGSSGLGGGLGMSTRAGKATTQIGKRMTAPYEGNATRQIVDDTAMGIGSGLGYTAAEDIAPDSPAAQIAGAMGGGYSVSRGTRTGEAMVRTPPRAIKDRMQTELPDGAVVTNREADDAALIMQELASDPKQASQNIRANMAENAEVNIPNGTTGMVADDVGLGSAEVGARSKTPKPFLEKDQAVRTQVAESVSDMRDTNADVTAPQRTAQQQADELRKVDEYRIDEAQRGVDELDAQRDVNLAEREELAAPVRAQRGEKARASRELDDQIGPDGALGERTTAKNQQFDDAARGQTADIAPIADSVRKVQKNINDLGIDYTGLPKGFIQKVEKILPNNQTVETGTIGADGMRATKEVNTGGTGQVKLEEVSQIRRELSSAIARARGQGEFDLADNLGTLKKDINAMIDETASFADAQKYYREEYAPLFAEGYGKQYRDTVQRNAERTGRADPGNIASIFLDGSRDAATDLRRIVDVAPDNDAAMGAVRRYMSADLASKLGAKPTPRAVSNWLADRADQLDQFPEIKTEFETLQRNLGNNASTESQLKLQIRDAAKALKNAEKNAVETERRINKGVLGTMINQDPDKYIASILGSKDRNKQLDEVISMIGNDKQAKDGLKRAVVEHLIGKVTGSNIKAVDAGDGPVIYNRLSSVLDDNTEALTKVLTPGEMNVLRRAQKTLGNYGNLSTRATTGADTAQKLNQARDQVFNALEAGLKLKYGVLKGGGILRTIKIAAKMGPNRVKNAEEIVARALLDPETAAHLLDRPLREVGTTAWNRRLNQLIGSAAGGREAGDVDESEE